MTVKVISGFKFVFILEKRKRVRCLVSTIIRREENWSFIGKHRVSVISSYSVASCWKDNCLIAVYLRHRSNLRIWAKRIAEGFYCFMSNFLCFILCKCIEYRSYGYYVECTCLSICWAYYFCCVHAFQFFQHKYMHPHLLYRILIQSSLITHKKVCFRST